MDVEIKDLSLEDLQRLLSALESSYADALGAHQSTNFLTLIWKKIREVRLEISNRHC